MCHPWKNIRKTLTELLNEIPQLVEVLGKIIKKTSTGPLKNIQKKSLSSLEKIFEKNPKSKVPWKKHSQKFTGPQKNITKFAKSLEI